MRNQRNLLQIWYGWLEKLSKFGQMSGVELVLCQLKIKCYLITTFVYFWAGESCTAHDSSSGVCVELPSCTTLINLYRANPTQNAVNILVANKKSCGDRKIGRNPLMCCSDGIPKTTRSATTTVSPNLCSTPDSLQGNCIGMIDDSNGINKTSFNNVISICHAIDCAMS